MVKKWYESKTIIVGILEILIGVLGLLAEFLDVADFTASAIALLVAGVLTIVLRFYTAVPVTL